MGLVPENKLAALLAEKRLALEVLLFTLPFEKGCEVFGDSWLKDVLEVGLAIEALALALSILELAEYETGLDGLEKLSEVGLAIEALALALSILELLAE